MGIDHSRCNRSVVITTARLCGRRGPQIKFPSVKTGVTRMTKKHRIEIPVETAAEVLFESNRTCCVCRERKPVQIHHIDENPANFSKDNLAVLCFDCHRDTQIRGGFDRKLDSAQIRRYRDDWIARVANKREKDHGPLILQFVPSALRIKNVKIIQIKESSDAHAYSIEAEYPQFTSDDKRSELELNSSVSSFVTKAVEDFRNSAIATSNEKLQMRQELHGLGWDSLSIVHRISLLTTDYLSIEFVFQTYGAGAAHSNATTSTLNFGFRPLRQIRLQDLFESSTNYLGTLSEYCVEQLHKLQPSHWSNPIERAEELKTTRDSWILSGAGPIVKNFEKFVFVNEGIKIFFDPYRVGSYAEGRYEVFVPFHVLDPFLSDRVKKALP